MSRGVCWYERRCRLVPYRRTPKRARSRRDWRLYENWTQDLPG